MSDNNDMPQVNKNDIFNYDFQKMFEERELKRKYRGAALLVGIPYLVCFAISHLWSRLYLFSASSLGISLENAINFVNEPGVNQLLQIFFSIIMFTFPFIISIIVSGRTVSQTVSLSKPEKRSIFPFVLIGFSFCIFSNVAVSYAGGIFENFGVDYSVDFGSNPSGFFGVLLSVISTCIVPAMVEEFAFRGIVLGRLLEFGESFAVFTTAVLFGIMHGNFEQMPFAILVGIILGFVRIKTGTLWVCILIHFLNNFLSVVMDYISEYFSAVVLNTSYAVFLCFSLLLFIPAILLCEKRYKGDAFNFNFTDEKITEKEKYKMFFSSPVIIVSIVFYGIEALKYFI